MVAGSCWLIFRSLLNGPARPQDLKAKAEPIVREQKGRPASEPQNVKTLPGPASCICYAMKDALRSLAALVVTSVVM